MGIFKTIGKGLKGVSRFVGGVAKKAAPFVGLIPGVGTLAGGAIGALGSAASDFGNSRKLSLGNALKSGIAGAASGLAGTKLLGGKGLPGLLSKAKGLMAPKAPVAGVPGQPYEVADIGVAREAGELPGGGYGPAPQGGGGLLNTIKGLITKKQGGGLDLGKIAGLGLAGANAISSAKQTGQANDRLSAARAMLAERPRPDLSPMFGSGNPYRRQRVA